MIGYSEDDMIGYSEDDMIGYSVTLYF